MIMLTVLYVLYFIDAIKNKFEDVHHRRGDDTGLKVFEYCVKKRTDKCNNAINMYASSDNLLLV